MKQKRYAIQILNLDTGIKVKHVLQGSLLTKRQILQLLQSYNPEIDFQNLVIYYFTRGKWIFFLDTTINLDQYENQWQIKDSDQILMRVKYNCYYLLDDDEEKRFNDDVKLMSEKINQVQELYQDLKEKYKQQDLDISILWGSPLFAADKIQRKKEIQRMDYSGEQVQLLTNQVKYAPYINAITTALQTCDKKVHLEIDQLNDKSFSQRNIFTVVYLMAHVQIEQSRNYSQKSHKKHHHQNRRQQNKAKNKRNKSYVQKVVAMKPPNLKETQSLSFPVLEKPALQKVASNGDEMEMVIEESNNHTNSSYFNSSSLYDSIQLMQTSAQYRNSSQQTSKIQIKEPQPYADIDEETEYRDYPALKEGNNKYYFLGEEVNGKLCKISPKKLSQIIKNRTSRNIQLLILHTSFPYQHLEQLRSLADNIILINSNPLFPQPSTIYFIKQLFIHLLQTGNIEQAYQLSIKDLNKLKEISTLMKENPGVAQQEFDKKQMDFVGNINQKYVHGSLNCCCCYHPHHRKCHNQKNKNASKFAQYHYKYHAGQCGCEQQHLMIHTCEGKKTFMTDHFMVLNKNYEDQQYYYCCCMGTDLGFYEKPSKNTHLQQLFNISELKDPHNIKFKYKHQKTMINQQDNQLQINEGKVTGDWNKQIVYAFKYIQDNPLLGNARLIIQLFQIFTQQLKKCTIDIIRRSNLCQMYNVCNIYGAKSTGRTTIATFFANLMIIKKLCKRIVIKQFSSVADIKNIVQSAQSQQGGRPFFILRHQEKNTNKAQKNILNIQQNHFKRPTSAIIITQHKIVSDSSLKVHHIQPIPFSNDNCQHYVKKYKHLSFQAKSNIKILFNFAIRGYKEGENVQIYPFSLNQFQILNLVKKTKFEQYKIFGQSLDRLDQSSVQYYILIMYIIKFTNSSNRKNSTFLLQIKRYIQEIKQERRLFFNKFNETIKVSQNKQESLSSNSSEYRGNINLAYESIINLDQIRDNFYLIFTSIGYKIKDKLNAILKIFINYSTAITCDQFKYNSKIKSQINYIRIKNTPFSKQVYEATTINKQSYINRYFSKDFQLIYEQYMQAKHKEKTNMHDFERFLMEHALILKHKSNLMKRSSYQSQPRPRQRRNNQNHHSLDVMREIQRSYSVQPSAYQIQQQNSDINNIYHLASVIEGGLQFVRNVVCTHFIYDRLKEDEKLSLLKLSMMLINNCIILLKNKKFHDIKQPYDLDDSPQNIKSNSNSPQKAYELTHSNHNLDSPNANRLNRSQQYEFAPSSNSRTYSGKDVMFNQSRQYGISASKSMFYNEDEKQSSGPVDQLLLCQLYRLSTHKGLLFLLDEISRRLQRFSTQNETVLRTKICVQLLSIQIRLEQLQVDKQITKVSIRQNNNDRHLNRIRQIFNEKNYNTSNIYRILRQQIKKDNRFQSDNQQLGLIKSHIVVSLALMASRYGKYKISKSLSREIDYFVQQWNMQVPFSRRISLIEQRIQTNEFLKTKQNPTQYGFLKSICDHQYVYLQILDAFTSERYWTKSSGKNHEIQIYRELLAIYHHFGLKNTKTKGDYYAKLQTIYSQLNLFRKKKEYPPLSAYIQNFVEDFTKQVQKQFEKLKTSLIAIFTAEDNRDYVKYSLSQQLQPVLNNILNSNGKQLFSIKKKLNLDTIYGIQSYRGCKYLCIFTSTGQRNSREQILIQSSQGKPQIIQKDRLIQAINSIPTDIIFVCLPRKKMLAQSIKKLNNYSKKYIVYFDFDIEHFDTFKQSISSNEQISIKDYFVIFQKMIMIATVKELIQRIILRQKDGDFKGFRTPYMAFNDIKNCLSFVLKDKNDKPMIRLTNQQFRNCLLIDGENFQESKSMQKKEVQFFDIQRINRFQIESLQKIVKKMSIRKENMNNKRLEQLKIDDFSNVNYFISIFSFYFRQKYGFDNIVDINVGIWRDLLKQSNIVKLFLQKLIQQKILDLIFSTKKVVIILYFDTQSNDKIDHFSSTLQTCEIKLWNIISGIDQTDSKRIINKFTGSSNIGKKKVNNAFVYMLQTLQSNQEKA